MPNFTKIQCDREDRLPSMFDLYFSHPQSYLVLLVIGKMLFLGICILSVIHVYYTWRYISVDRIRNKLLVICLLYPVLAAFCFAAMISPRVGPIFTSIGVVYILYSLYNTVSLARVIYRSEEALSEALMEEEYRLQLQVPPCCCCCPCMPKLVPTVENLRWFERVVLQAVFFRFAMEFINVFVLAEYGVKSAKIIQYVDICGVPSLLFAVFAAQVMIRLSTEYLRAHKMMALFFLVVTTLPLYCMQPVLFFELLFIKLNFFPCGPLLPTIGNARYVFNFVMLCELLIMSIVASIVVIPKKTVLFDKYYRKPEEEVAVSLKESCRL